ncbi:MAG: hypothetical protein QXL09_03190 [Candidatus Aenigmatarchaeota archaeon]
MEKNTSKMYEKLFEKLYEKLYSCISFYLNLRRNRSKIIFSLSFLFFLSLISSVSFSTIVANSNDWRDVYILMIYSYYNGEKFNFINSLGEAEILAKTLRKNESISVFESRQNSIVKGYANFLRLKGFQSVSEDIFINYESLQFDLYQLIKKNISGFIIVKDDFGYDAISVAPYAINKNYWVFLYNPDTKRRILEILKINSDKEVIFYGEFLDRPWKKITNPTYIIDEKNSMKNNIKILDIFSQLLTNNSWLILVGGDYLDEIFILQKMPITFTSQNLEDIINWCLKNNVKLIEVIGPENVDFGQRIREQSNRTIGVVVKTGRTFTGDPELRGKQFVLRVMGVDIPLEILKIEEVYFLPNMKEIVLIISNEGNVDLYYYISGIGAFYGEQEIFPQFSPELHFIPKGKRLSIPIPIDLNKTPDKIELLLTYGYQYPFEKVLDKKIYDVEASDIYDEFNITLLEAFYDIFNEKLGITLINNEDKEVFTSLEIFDFEILGLNRSLLIPPTKLQSREKKTLFFDIYLDEEDLEKNKEIKIRLYSGRKEDFMVTSSKKVLELQPKKSVVTSLITMLISSPSFLVIILIIIVIFILIFLLKRRKKKEEQKIVNIGM